MNQRHEDRSAVYLLRADEIGARRLRLVNDAYGPASRSMLLQSGLAEGSRVVEFGCGPGEMTTWLAAQVGSSGRVVAVDRSDAQLAIASGRCSSPWVDFHRADAASTGLEPGSFDLAYIRLLLMHVPQPERVLAHARELLRPGGMLCCEELVITSSFCDPPQPAQAELHQIALAMAATRGCDFDIGARLHSMLVDVGFSRVGASAHQPTSAAGASKHIESLSLRETIEFLEDPDEIARVTTVCDALARAADDPRVVYGQARMVQVWATA